MRPFAWLNELLSTEQGFDVLLITNWRGEQAPYLLFALGSDKTVVAKRAPADARRQIERESAMLKALTPRLDRCGLAVPRLIDFLSEPTLATIIETDVPGRPMAGLIREGHYRDLTVIADRLAEWLACWSSKTVRHVELTSQLAEELILAPARLLADSIDRGSAYLQWLLSQTARLKGSNVPLVAAHNDLTMANVLGNAAGICSIVDWEAASVDGLPLADFRYAVCDAAALVMGKDRVSAFRACFSERGEHRDLVQRCEVPLRELAGGPPEWLELCVQAGWLGHAVNEQARSRSARFDDSFLAIANLIANTVVDH